MIKFLIRAISRSLGFSKSESKGTLVLIFVMFVALITANYRISYLKNTTPIVSDSTDLEWVKEVQASYQVKKISTSSKEKAEVRPSKSIENSIEEKSSYRGNGTHSSRDRDALHVVIQDLNTATSEELQIVRGIGKAFSSRIVKYRTLLGGFSDSTQLNEVYGLSEETIKEVFKFFSIQSQVKPIELNTDSIRVLSSHPYISYDLARVIINYRKEHGDIQSLDDVKKIKAIDERTFSRLRPYLE